MIGTMTDINDKHQAEQKSLKLSIEKAAAEISDIQKSKFLANMSHEIRTPLNAIIHMNRLAIDSEKPIQKNHYLKDSLSAAKNLLNIINDILDYSKIEAGKLAIETIPFDFYELIQSVLTISNSDAATKNITIISDVDDNIPILEGDPTRLRQVLINLVSNAIKYSSSDDTVFINISQENNDNDVILEISVSDSGIGISEEQKSILFKPFSQADSSTTRKFGGTGLGLSIVKNLIEIMGGEIKVESQLGKGTTFTIKVKLQQVKPDSIDQEALHRLSLKNTLENALNVLHGKRIMIVEDNSFNMKVLRDTLVNNGMEVISAENGQVCLDLLKNNLVDCILMDCQMPVLDGYETTRILRNLPEHKNLPIISMTASAMNQDIQKSLNAGMNDHISKPFDLNEMFIIMSKWIKADDQVE
jgi:CheY-like chemotaxis protein